MAKSNGPADHTDSNEPRRNFIVEVAAVVIGGIVSLCGLASGVFVFLDPISRKPRIPEKYRKKEGAYGNDFIFIASLAALPDDGVPRRFPVITNKIDAWNFMPNQAIGSVYLRREKGEKTVQVFHTTCPHAGCSVAYKHDVDPTKRAYVCPCHNSAFDLDGEKIEYNKKRNPSPRTLDTLEFDQSKLDDGQIWIRFEDFYTGVHDKKAKI